MNKIRIQLQAIAFLMLAAISTARGELVTDFVTATNAAATNLFSGRVGIGTSTPATLLDINGSAIVRGNLIASNGLTVSGPVSGITAAQVGAVSTTDRLYRAALTNAAQFATAAQGALASTALQPTGSGANLTGITAAQVGAVAMTNSRYLAALTNIPAGAVGTAQLAVGAVTTGKLDLATLDLRYATSTTGLVGITNRQSNVTLGTNVICAGSLSVSNNLVVNGVFSGNGIGITNVSVTASQVTTGTLSAARLPDSGVWNAVNLYLPSVDSIPMGSFTNAPRPYTKECGGTASASSTYTQNAAQDAFDGSVANQLGWGNYNIMPCWLAYNYGSTKIITRYRIYCASDQVGGWNSANNNPKTWDFQGSNDGATWTTLHHVDDGAITMNQWATFDFSNAKTYAMYRIYIANAVSGNWTHISELELYSQSSAACVQVSTGGTASASSTLSGNAPQDAFAGSVSNQRGWGNNNSMPCWLEYDYLSAQVLTRYRIYCASDQVGGWNSENFNPKTWDFQGSNDGATWTTLHHVDDGALTMNQWATFNFSNMTAYPRYRLCITSAENGNWTHVSELDLSQTRATAPSWWVDYGVVDTNATPNDFGPINQGQLKWIASQAARVIADEFPGFASSGTNITTLLATLAPGANEYRPVNLGQLKFVAAPLYDFLFAHLAVPGVANYYAPVYPSGSALPYPWSGSTNLPNDYALATIGQAKYVFGFNLGWLGMANTNAWANGVPDWWAVLNKINPLNSSSNAVNALNTAMVTNGVPVSYLEQYLGGLAQSGLLKSTTNLPAAGRVCTIRYYYDRDRRLTSAFGNATGTTSALTYTLTPGHNLQSENQLHQ